MALRLGATGLYAPLVVYHNTSTRLLDFTRHTQHEVSMVVDGPTHSQLVGNSIGGEPYLYVTKGLLTHFFGIATPTSITYIELVFSDGFTTYFGSQHEHGERLATCVLYRNTPGSDVMVAESSARVYGICFTTTHGRTFELVFDMWRKRDAFVCDVGSGYVVGCDACSGAELDAFSFVFLRPLCLFRYVDTISSDAATPTTTRRSTPPHTIKNIPSVAMDHWIEMRTSTTRTVVHAMLRPAISHVGQLDMQLNVAGGVGGGLRVGTKQVLWDDTRPIDVGRVPALQVKSRRASAVGQRDNDDDNVKGDGVTDAGCDGHVHGWRDACHEVQWTLYD
ncbi:Aste57867_25080 [Aphanomyces stellatus]|uniref:Aste57867_25080 protein n=1 Tax=Aphanomyces stellatus TaxID=120398 RepID=A0A485LUA9_9STRA|nr:hypothetical protein As57867_025002 [Aphanomyces stellatus]VFU01711.1 Aste57867_25080 [Aphanomyces stellatus]